MIPEGIHAGRFPTEERAPGLVGTPQASGFGKSRPKDSCRTRSELEAAEHPLLNPSGVVAPALRHDGFVGDETGPTASRAGGSRGWR